MAKITRKKQEVFGESAGGLGITEFGSAAQTGTPTYSDDPDDIQTAEWLVGWQAAALAGSRIPGYQDFNAIHYVATRQIAYILQEGIPEYSATTEYHQNSIVKAAGTTDLYVSLTNDNEGNLLTDGANWQLLDLSGSNFGTTTNTGNAYEVTTFPVTGSLGEGGKILSIIFNAANTGNVTLNVNGLGAESVLDLDGAEIPAGGIVADRLYILVWDGTDFRTRIDPQSNLPVGSILDFAGAAAPSGFLLCDGAAVSRATYADLFTALGTAYGAGDGSTTFNLPDLRGRVSVGKDDMGGSAASRVTSTTVSPNGNTLGAAGGTQTHQLTISEMPSHNHTTPARSGSGASNIQLDGSATLSNIASSFTGGDDPHLNIQPSLIVNKIIKF